MSIYYDKQSPLLGTAKQANMVSVGSYKIGNTVLEGIRQASRKTGVDFSYLMAQAAQESSFKPEAQANSTSAKGLYQFIEQTWLAMVYAHGHNHGLGNLVAKIEPNGRDRYKTSDPISHQKILELRTDPKISAALSAEYALDNKMFLESTFGRKMGATELYLAHFLGANGATRLLNAIENNPLQPAANLLPAAASTNRMIFYDNANGQPRTVGEVYALFNHEIKSKANAFSYLDKNINNINIDTISPYSASGIMRRELYEVSSLAIMALAALSLPPTKDNDIEDDKTTVQNQISNSARKAYNRYIMDRQQM